MIGRLAQSAALLALVLLAAFPGGCATGRAADLVLLGGKIVTMDPERPEVQALAARDGIVIAIGSDDRIRSHIGDESIVIELDGRLVVPGFIEGHGHLTGLGRSRIELDLRHANSWNEIVGIAARAAAEAGPGAWVVGWGWHQEKLDPPPSPSVEGYPTHDSLSLATPDNPVLLRHAAGSHGGLANLSALQAAGIDGSTPDPAGGQIVRDREGRATGVLRDTAYDLVYRAWQQAEDSMTSEQVAARTRKEVDLAVEECLAKGITSFQDAGSDFHTIDTLREMARAGELGIRVWVMIDEDNDALEREIESYRFVDDGDRHLTVRAIKRSVDGALGSHSAWLLEPYSDLSTSVGLNTIPLDDLERTARIAAEHELQLCVHAIGDRGNREVLDIFERTFAAFPDRSDWRWRVEHAQHLNPRDIPRFAELNVVASMQSVHCTSDGPWVPQRLGAERSEQGAYVWRKLLDTGVVISNGTDTPVEDVDPIANYHAAVTREMNNGEAFYPGQRMTRMEALRAATTDAAFAAFEEQVKGSLGPGKLADLVVLSEDILTVAEHRIADAQVLYTVVGGRVMFER